MSGLTTSLDPIGRIDANPQALLDWVKEGRYVLARIEGGREGGREGRECGTMSIYSPVLLHHISSTHPSLPPSLPYSFPSGKLHEAVTLTHAPSSVEGEEEDASVAAAAAAAAASTAAGVGGSEELARWTLSATEGVKEGTVLVSIPNVLTLSPVRRKYKLPSGAAGMQVGREGGREGWRREGQGVHAYPSFSLLLSVWYFF